MVVKDPHIKAAAHCLSWIPANTLAKGKAKADVKTEQWSPEQTHSRSDPSTRLSMACSVPLMISSAPV